MRLTAIIATVVVLSELSGTAHANMVGPYELPAFSEVDEIEIARSDLLGAVRDRDPWLVRRILDLGVRAGTSDHPLEPVRRDASGSVEWMDLLRRARAERDAAQEKASAPASRSSEGSVEMMELMKAAKQRKKAQ